MLATKIKMKYGCENSMKCEEIEQIYLTGYEKFFYKSVVYDLVKQYPNTIKVKDNYGPYVIPAISRNLEKYVRSAPNDTIYDNLLKLPRV